MIELGGLDRRRRRLHAGLRREVRLDVVIELALCNGALLGEWTGEWMALSKYLEQYLGSPDIARTAVASSFGATLEMAREGLVEISQAEPFAPIYVRKREDGAAWQRIG